MYFSPDAIKTALGEIKSGVTFVTDTNMALSGINKKALKELNCNAVCYVSDEDVAVMAKKENITRAVCAVKKAAMNNQKMYYGCRKCTYCTYSDRKNVQGK